MHLGTIRTRDGRVRAAVNEDGAWLLLESPDVGALIAEDGWEDAVAASRSAAGAERLSAGDAEILPPVLRPAKVICCGLNYRDHIAETGRETPEYPTLFAKFADTLAGPEDDIAITGSAKVDWEAELAVVVGRPLRRATAREAESAILGYTVANDVSCRDWQARTLQWFQGKAWDATTPIGPVIVTADEISPEEGLEISCAIDGETVQRSSTRELLFDSAALLAYVSQFTALRPGDIILTGTPDGVGLGRNPQRWLRDGQLLTTTIEGIGALRNRMRISTAGTEGRS